MARRAALAVALTGGIGTGKSAALARFAELGAVTIDSDDVAREVVAPGSEGFSAVVEWFGPDVVGADGALDRARLASIVFVDSEARAVLEAIVHPRVRAVVRRRVDSAGRDSVVVNAVPLLVEAGLVADYDRVVVVEAPLDLRLERLTASRRMTREEALSRIAAQASDERRREVAWRTIVNDGSLEDLKAKVDDVWRALSAEP